MAPCFGSIYEILDNGKLLLSDFGTVKILDYKQQKIKISITSDFASESDLIAAKQSVVSGSEQTKKLCRTWVITTIDGENAEWLSEEDMMVSFTQYGTYVVTFGGVAQWRWKDAGKLNFAIPGMVLQIAAMLSRLKL